MQDYKKLIEKYEKDLIRNRRYLHQHPELGFDLDHTVQYVKEELTAMGCKPIDIGDHGGDSGNREKRGQMHSASIRYGCPANEGRERIAFFVYL